MRRLAKENVIDREWLQPLGPGLVTDTADDDPSGIATYSQVGAQFGYAMLWVAVPVMIVMMLMTTNPRVMGKFTRVPRPSAWLGN